MVVVDDEPAVIQCVSLILSKWLGVRVVTAGDSHTALRLIARTCPDLVVSDINRPGMNGIEFLRVLRRKSPRLPVFMLSGFLTRERERMAYATGANACLSKPFGLPEFLGVVRRLLIRRSHVFPRPSTRRPSCVERTRFGCWRR